MTKSIFWELIDIAHERAGGDFEKETALLVDYLIDFTTDDIADFAAFLRSEADDLCSTGIFAAFYILFNEGPSALDFFNFRIWLLGHGSAFVNRLTADPTLLDELIMPDDKTFIRQQGLSHVPLLAWYVKTRRTHFPGPDVRQSMDIEIPVTEMDIRQRYLSHFPRLNRMFWHMREVNSE